MARLIDADELLKHKGNCYDENGHLLYGVGTGTILKMPTVDAVPVVRCMECRYSYDSVGGLCCSHGVCVDCVVPEDFFCRYGKRKGGDE